MADWPVQEDPEAEAFISPEVFAQRKMKHPQPQYTTRTLETHRSLETKKKKRITMPL